MIGSFLQRGPLCDVFGIGGAVQGASSIAAAGIQAGAATSAANMEADAARYAADQTSKTAANSLGFNQNVFNTGQQNYKPFIQAGQTATNNLATETAPGGSLNTPYGKTFSYQPFSFSGDVLKNDPAYQFDLQQGQQAIQRSAAAQGGLVSGGSMKALADYTQGNALNAYQTAYNTEANTYDRNYQNALQQYQQAYNQWNTDQNNSYARQSGLATLGENAAAGSGSQGTAAAQTNAGINANTANALGNYATQVGNAQAAGTVGVGQAINNGISGVSNAYNQAQILNSLNGSSYNPPAESYFNGPDDLANSLGQLGGY